MPIKIVICVEDKKLTGGFTAESSDINEVTLALAQSEIIKQRLLSLVEAKLTAFVERGKHDPEN